MSEVVVNVSPPASSPEAAGDASPTYSLFAAELKEDRKQVLTDSIKAFIAIILLIWTLLPIFYGSTSMLGSYFHRINVVIYDNDSTISGRDALIGPYITKGLMASMEQPVHFTFQVTNTKAFIYDDYKADLINNDAWAAVVIDSYATVNYDRALNLSFISPVYDPSAAVTIFVASARFYEVVLDYVVPMLIEVLERPIHVASSAAAELALSTFEPAQLANANAMSALSTPFGYNVVDIRPILPNQFSGNAPLQAGLIYFIIFAYTITLLQSIARMPILMARKRGLVLSYRSILLLRFGPTFVIYFFMSLWYSLINIAFKVPMDGNGHMFSYGIGFMVFWALNFLTISALGLAMESLSTILDHRFFPFFLFTWIILNITSSFLPSTLMTPFYRYGYAMPFYHSTTADKAIFWGARNQLGLNFGVLAGWTVISIFSLSLFEWIIRRRAAKQHSASIAAAASALAEEEHGQKQEREIERTSSGDASEHASGNSYHSERERILGQGNEENERARME